MSAKDKNDDDYKTCTKNYKSNKRRYEKEFINSDLRNKINDLRKNNNIPSFDNSSKPVNTLAAKERKEVYEEPPKKRYKSKNEVLENDFLQHDKVKSEPEKPQSSHIVILESNDLDLYKEYIQWDFINNNFYGSCEKLFNVQGRNKQELKNTLQRWFIYINEDFNNVNKYEYYNILPDIDISHHAAQFLRAAIIEKQFVDEHEADKTIKIILNMISKSHDNVIPHNLVDPLQIKYDEIRKVITVNDFHSPEVPQVYLLVNKGGIIASARMLLRYESFGNGSYQWGYSKRVHKVLHDHFDVRYEGFASPVNSRFIEYENANFCSLFPDTDKVFGSLGNFFDVDMTKYSGGWAVNPPFLNDLMKKLAETIETILNNKDNQCYFFCTFPCWEDDEGWNILNNSKHLMKRFDLKPRQYIVQDAYGREFFPRVKMNLFVLGQPPQKKFRIEDLGSIFIQK